MADIKAIETSYNGYRFRSRLEARWAVFFDVAGIKYQYEVQGYKSTQPYEEYKEYYYLPDFYLPELDVFVEVKPTFDKLMEDSSKIGCMIDFDSTPISKGLLVLGDIPYYKKGSGKIPNFLKFSCRKGVQGEFCYFSVDNHSANKVYLETNYEYVCPTEDFNLPGHEAYEYCLGYDWHEQLFLLNTHINPHYFSKQGHMYTMETSWKERISDFLQPMFEKARRARFEHGECG